jgi:hypothetical protein
MLGRAAIAMWWDIAPDLRAEFEDWHSHEHMPERLGIPGFLRGSRWIAASGEPSYFVLYETARPATTTSGPYLDRLNDPTPWTRKMAPLHLNMVRSLCRVRARFGGGLPHALATIRFSPARGFAKALTGRLMPELARRRGLTGAHLLESQPMSGTQTAEQKMRGGDATADRVLLIGGYDAEVVAAASREVAPSGAATGLYRLSYSLAARDSA